MRITVANPDRLYKISIFFLVFFVLIGIMNTWEGGIGYIGTFKFMLNTLAIVLAGLGVYKGKKVKKGGKRSVLSI